MKDASEDERIEDLLEPSSKYPTTKVSQSERAEQLRRMMEDEDKTGMYCNPSKQIINLFADEETDVTGRRPLTAQELQSIDAYAPQDRTSSQSLIIVADRRRGRRKVMKKKTTKDNEGYLGLSNMRCKSCKTFESICSFTLQ